MPIVDKFGKPLTENPIYAKLTAVFKLALLEHHAAVEKMLRHEDDHADALNEIDALQSSGMYALIAALLATSKRRHPDANTVSDAIVWHIQLFAQSMSRSIAGWCVKYPEAHAVAYPKVKITENPSPGTPPPDGEEKHSDGESSSPQESHLKAVPSPSDG